MLQEAISVGHRLLLVDWNTGLIEFGSDTRTLAISAPTTEILELARRLVMIQDSTHVELSLTEEERFSAQDIDNAELASRIVATGRAQLGICRMSFSVHDPSTVDSRIGEKILEPLVEKDFSLEILGSRISLGEAHILCRGVLKKLDAPDSEHQFCIEASPDEPFLAVFPKWLNKTDAPTGPSDDTPKMDGTLED
jgi:hypothetical protein